MKILFVQPTGDRRGHYGLYTTHLCQALAQAGHEVTLVTNAIEPERFLPEPPSFQLRIVGGGRLSFSRFERRDGWRRFSNIYGYLRNSFLVLREALRMAHREPYQILHLTGIEFLVSTVLVRWYRLRVPAVMEVSAANFSYATYAGPRYLRVYKVFQRECFKRTLGRQIRALAVLGEYHRDSLAQQLKLNNQLKVAVVPDGGAAPAHEMDRESARRSIGLPASDVPLLLFFGLLRHDKGIETLLEAVSLCSESRFQLLLAGHPVDYSPAQIHAMLRKWGIAEKVITRLDYVPDAQVAAYYFASDALVLPYRRIYRGGSGPLMKGACMHGRASIVTAVSEMGRLVPEHDIGLVAEPESPAQLADRIREFLALDETRRHGMEERARALAQANSWDAMAVKLGQLYVDIQDERPQAQAGRGAAGRAAWTGDATP